MTKDMLSDLRIGQGGQETHALPLEIAHRSPYEADTDRIAFCDAFRRLQDKTQVHGPAGNDYIRTRLTHSLEVSRVGRQIGEIFGAILKKRRPELCFDHHPSDYAAVTAAACLMHDIGNPPFGHTGEKAISEFFKATDTGREVLRRLGDHPVSKEASKFEGNAQGLRIVSRLQGWRSDSGLRLTAAVLAGFCKYPFAATSSRSKAKGGKYGFFSSEADVFAIVAEATGMQAHADGGWKRHPVAYLVEAADDTCYRIVDIEDGYVMNCLSFEEAEGMLISVAGTPDADYVKIPTRVKKLTRLRSLAISRLVVEIAHTIDGNLDEIISGDHPGDLVVQGPSAAALAPIAKVSKTKIYKSSERLQTDLVAHKTLTAMLDTYLMAFMERQDGKVSAWSDSILQAFPHATSVGLAPEDYVRIVLDYVSGMTDEFALRQATLFPAPQRRAA
jgi:dGTPase